jgi:8-oxo-dGTP diphosphatase
MNPLASTCLCLLTRTTADGVQQVLLGHKKTGLGTGNIVGLGGHVEPGETPREAAAREAREEAGVWVDPAALLPVAEIVFRFPVRPSWDMEAFVFTSDDWHGEPAESDEITPEWFAVSDLPLTRMWDDARLWLPRALAGEHIRATFSYADDCSTVASHRAWSPGSTTG